MQKILDDAVREGRDLTSMGKTADYIPELGRFRCKIYDPEYIKGYYTRSCIGEMRIRESFCTCRDGTVGGRIQFTDKIGSDE